jgi:hypothetical protein
MKQHGLLAIWLLAITVSAVLLFSGCRPVPAVVNDDGQLPLTCTVEAGDPTPLRIGFDNVCSTDPAPPPMIPDLWCGPTDGALIQIYPGLDNKFQLDVLSCDDIQCHIQWIESGNIYDKFVRFLVEPSRFQGGEFVYQLYPDEGCPE